MGNKSELRKLKKQVKMLEEKVNELNEKLEEQEKEGQIEKIISLAAEIFAIIASIIAIIEALLYLLEILKFPDGMEPLTPSHAGRIPPKGEKVNGYGEKNCKSSKRYYGCNNCNYSEWSCGGCVSGSICSYD